MSLSDSANARLQSLLVAAARPFAEVGLWIQLMAIRWISGLPLIRRSLQVMRQSPGLLFFPIVLGLASALAVVLVSTDFDPKELVMARPGVSASHPTLMNGWSAPPWAVGRWLGVYLIGMFAATFWNVAFYHEIMQALAGERVSLARGLRVACHRLPAILVWSALSATVGLVLRMVAQGGPFSWLNRMLLGTAAIAWSVGSVFIIPVMIREKSADPVALLRGSAAVLRKGWSDAIIGYAGIAGGGIILVVLWLLLCGGALFVAALFGSAVAIVACLVLGALGAIAILFLCSVTVSVHKAALYIYAVEGVVPGPFNAGDLGGAWRIGFGAADRGR